MEAPLVLACPVLTFVVAFLAVAGWNSPAIRSMGYEYEADLPLPEGLASAEGILVWMQRSIRYQSEDASGERDYWQTPRKTLERGTGDCEDLSILFMFLCKRYLGVESRLLVVGRDRRSTYDHTVVSVQGVWYDPTLGQRVADTSYWLFYDFSYARSLWMAETHHAGVVQGLRPMARRAVSSASPAQDG